MEKIKIIKADENKWYKDRIGKIYQVKNIIEFPSGGKWIIIRNYRTLLRTVYFDDVEFLNDNSEP